MGAEYTSPKPDGYMKTRNEIYQHRQKKMIERTMEEQSALRNLPPQSKENYGKKTYK